ncbi:MAG: c-type cytochrome, partial [Haloferula sp.]
GELVTRNGRYGGPIKKMLDNPAPTREIDYAFMLRNVRYGWTLEQRRAYVTFLNKAAKFPGGASFAGFLKNLRTDALKNASDSDRAALADLTGEKLTPDLGFEVTPPKGPGQAWTMESALAVLEAPGALEKRDFAAGRNLFHATSCVACHRFDGTGGAIGPDLTTVGNKFNNHDLLESIIHPSKVISDQYGSSTVTRNDGTTVTGLVVEDGDLVEVYTSDPTGKPVSISHSDIKSIAAVSVSQMPPALINTLSADELRDFAAFLLSRGNPNDPMFKK